jgi:hypothetical protein
VEAVAAHKPCAEAAHVLRHVFLALHQQKTEDHGVNAFRVKDIKLKVKAATIAAFFYCKYLNNIKLV